MFLLDSIWSARLKFLSNCLFYLPLWPGLLLSDTEWKSIFMNSSQLMFFALTYSIFTKWTVFKMGQEKNRKLYCWFHNHCHSPTATGRSAHITIVILILPSAYIQKANKLAVIYFWAQKNWRKKCVYQDDKSAFIMKM